MNPFEKGDKAGAMLMQALQLAESGRLSLKDLVAISEQAQAVGDLQGVVSLYQRWLARTSDPMAYVAWFNLGAILQSVGLRLQAIEAYQGCLALVPMFPVAMINLGLCLEGEGRHEAALSTWISLADASIDEQKLPGIDEHKITAVNHCARLYEDLLDYQNAEVMLERSLRMKAGQADPVHHWVHLQQRICKWPIPREIEGARLHDITLNTSPLPMLALSDDPVQQLLTAREFVRRKYGFEEQFLSAGRKYQHSRLRVGYVSGDLCTHAVGLLMPAVLEGHDRAKIEVYGYDFSPEDGTAVRARLKAAFDHFRDIRALSDAQVISMILDDEIDVLIDLHGLSQGARPKIFAAHPAPLQGQFLGYIGTTGMPWHDFVVTDKIAFQNELRPYYTETPLFVDGCFLPLDPVIPEEILRSSRLTRSELGLPSDRLVLAALNNSYKITEIMWATWLEILKRAPETVLWLIDDNPIATANLKRAARSGGIKDGRIIFTKRLGYYQYAASLVEADLYLDTYPYNCGSTARDVIASGIPLITIAGNTVVSRMALSAIHHSKSVHSFSTSNVQEYLRVTLSTLATMRSLDFQEKRPQADLPTKSTSKTASSLDKALLGWRR